MKKLLLALLPLVLLPVVLLVASPAIAETPTVELRPGSLPRGADVPDPHVEGRVLHDGAMRMTFRASRVTFLGMSGDRYVVHLSRTDGSNAHVIWIRADESQRVLQRGLDVSQVMLSHDGRHLLTTPRQGRAWTQVRVRDARTGRILTTHSFRGAVSVLDADGGRAVLGGWGPNRTFWWHYGDTDDTTRISGRVGYAADIRADRVASYTRDPYLDGCSVVTDLAADPTRLWSSCAERVEAFTPDGRRVATVHILSDGLGPNRVHVRRTEHGAVLAHYTATWFGALRWESGTALLLDTVGRSRAATVRCTLADCERASDLKPAPEY